MRQQRLSLEPGRAVGSCRKEKGQTASTGRRRAVAGDRSTITEMTAPIIGTTLHSPPYQCWTIEYHRVVSGRKIKPKIGQRMFGNTPVNQLVKSQRRMIVTLGSNIAKSATRKIISIQNVLASCPARHWGMLPTEASLRTKADKRRATQPLQNGLSTGKTARTEMVTITGSMLVGEVASARRLAACETAG